MPLFIDGALLPSDRCKKDFVFSAGSLKERSIEFLSNSMKVNICTGDRALYVSQREYATVSKQHQTIKMIGSGDATTCHILILVSANSLSVGHFDGSNTEHGLLSMIRENSIINCHTEDGHMESKQIIMAYVFGGFDDDRDISRKLFEDILHTMSLAKQEIHLITSCVCSLNTRVVNGNNHPIIYGVAIDTQSNQIFQASFESKGPCDILRNARIFGGCTEMVSIYDTESQMVQIGPFEFRVFRGANDILGFDDRQILQILSTSPHCEPDDFVSNTRKAIKFLIDHPFPETIFKKWEKLSFKMDELGNWIQQP